MHACAGMCIRGFPGSEEHDNCLFEICDADLLAEAIEFTSTHVCVCVCLCVYVCVRVLSTHICLASGLLVAR